MFLTLTQYEAFIGAPDPAYSALPLLLIFMCCVVLLLPNRLLRYTLILLLNFFLIFTGFGIFMGVITLGVFGLNCYWRLRRIISEPFWHSIAGLILAASSLGAFFLHYTFDPAVSCFEFPQAISPPIRGSWR